MVTKVGINGFGRIGRQVLRAIIQRHPDKLTVAAVKALNAYFPMPFRKSALITVTNEGAKPVDAYYANIDYQVLPRLPENVGYFHAQYRQSAPCPGWATAVEKNLDGLFRGRVAHHD